MSKMSKKGPKYLLKKRANMSKSNLNQNCIDIPEMDLHLTFFFSVYRGLSCLTDRKRGSQELWYCDIVILWYLKHFYWGTAAAVDTDLTWMCRGDTWSYSSSEFAMESMSLMWLCEWWQEMAILINDIKHVFSVLVVTSTLAAFLHPSWRESPCRWRPPAPPSILRTWLRERLSGRLATWLPPSLIS